MTRTRQTKRTLHPSSLPGQTGHTPLGVSGMSGLGDVRELASPLAANEQREAGSILALDLGTATGWALRRTDGVVLSGTARLRTH
jgi:hypothetical protein